MKLSYHISLLFTLMVIEFRLIRERTIIDIKKPFPKKMRFIQTSQTILSRENQRGSFPEGCVVVTNSIKEDAEKGRTLRTLRKLSSSSHRLTPEFL